VIRRLSVMPRPPVEGLRWTTRDQWHVTLRFVGEVGDAEDVIDPLRATPLGEPATAVAGPASVWLNPTVLALPVDGLTGLARAVTDATSGVGEPPETRPFPGHVTLARVRARRSNQVGRAARARWSAPPALEPLEVAESWSVNEVVVVASALGGTGSTYRVVGRVSVG
jgi:2'-5' RNA ligase